LDSILFWQIRVHQIVIKRLVFPKQFQLFRIIPENPEVSRQLPVQILIAALFLTSNTSLYSVKIYMR